MPDRWTEYVDDMGSKLRAARMESGFRVTTAEGEVSEGKPGDYLVKGADGLRRVIKAEAFEARYTEVVESEPPAAPESESKPDVTRLKKE